VIPRYQPPEVLDVSHETYSTASGGMAGYGDGDFGIGGGRVPETYTAFGETNQVKSNAILSQTR
jgi:hypothetical protein